jgi:hypothetical protein
MHARYVVVGVILLCAASSHPQPAKPNVVFILMDNLG